MKNKEKGELFLVSTPIGNLSDITIRAIDVLRESDIIACEDTRRTLRLLKKFEIKKPLESFYDHNKEKKTPYLLRLLDEGKKVSLVSDSGTPCISDPGFYLVKMAIEKNFNILSVPGPSSILSGLILSGLPTDRFTFEGFLPRKKGKRKKRLQELSTEKRTMIIFESPKRILPLLYEFEEILGNRRISISRELTKIYEETLRGTVSDLIKHFGSKIPKGEFIIVLGGKKE